MTTMTKVGKGPAQVYRYEHGQGYVLAHTGEVELLIDIPALLKDLGGRALKSKRGVSKLKGGLITVQVTKRGQP